MAEVIVSDWLKLCTPDFALRQGKDIQKVYDVEKSLIEIIKYGTKIFTEPDLKKRAKETTTVQIYINALNTILLTMKGKRIFDRFGFNAPKQTNNTNTSAKLLSSFNEWQFNAKFNDWENTETGEMLTVTNCLLIC